MTAGFVHGQAGGRSVFYQMGLAEAAGPTQGLPPALQAAGLEVADSPFGTGPVDAVVGAVAGDAAPAVGLVKFAVDATTFIVAGGACALGFAHE